MGPILTGALLLYDGHDGDGLGHRRRMESVGRALAGVGIAARVAEAGTMDTDEILIVDSYRYRADSFRAHFVAGLDDLCRDLRVDLVIDPAPQANASMHPRAGAVLAGPRYAITGDDVRLCEDRGVADVCEHVLVVAGGEGHGLAEQIAATVARVVPDGVQVDTPQSWFDPRSATESHGSRPELGALLAASDLVVTAAGVTLYESLALGRPTVTFISAKNQRRQAVGAATRGAAVLVDLDDIADAVRLLLADPQRRRKLAATSRQLLDAHGAERIAEVIAHAI